MNPAPPTIRLADDGRGFLDAGGAVVAHLAPLNALESSLTPDQARKLPAGTIMLRTGWTDTPEPLWLARYRDQFARFVESVEGSEIAARVVWWPLATDVISDGPSLLTFLRANPVRRFLFDPQGLLTDAMLPKAQDHLARLEAALSTHPACWARLARERL